MLSLTLAFLPITSGFLFVLNELWKNIIKDAIHSHNLSTRKHCDIYIGMFGLVAKIEVLDDECNGKWTVKILDIIKQSSNNKKYKMDDVNVGDIVRLDYGFLFNSKKLAISYAEESKKFVPEKWSGNSLLGLPF